MVEQDAVLEHIKRSQNVKTDDDGEALVITCCVNVIEYLK